jgi:HEPN domain-containing protein
MSEKQATMGDDWLLRASPREWIREAVQEIREAEKSLAQRDQRTGYACLRRGAGKALNGALLLEPNPGWGRSYMDHVRALAADTTVPEAVRSAAQKLVGADPNDRTLVLLVPTRHYATLVEAAKDVVAHAYAVIVRHEGRMPDA